MNYSPKGGGDIDITLYFDKDTFRHTRTEYKRTSSASIGRTIDESARQSETRMKVVEDFSDFKEFNGLTLPQTYKLLYTITGANGTTEVEWAYHLTEFAFNQPMDEKTFDADAKSMIVKILQIGFAASALFLAVSACFAGRREDAGFRQGCSRRCVVLARLRRTPPSSNRSHCRA